MKRSCLIKFRFQNPAHLSFDTHTHVFLVQGKQNFHKRKGRKVQSLPTLPMALRQQRPPLLPVATSSPSTPTRIVALHGPLWFPSVVSWVLVENFLGPTIKSNDRQPHTSEPTSYPPWTKRTHDESISADASRGASPSGCT